MRILAIADEITPGIVNVAERPDLVVSCGDLPWDELERVVDHLNVPLLYVPGNHDPALVPRARAAVGTWPMPLESTALEEPPGPRGCTNVDGRIEDVGGVRFAGLGGSIRYREGPNQYTQSEMTRRARRLADRAMVRRVRDHRRVDVLLTHAPPKGLGDEDDPAHEGIRALHALVRRLQPRFLLHGHIHPYGVHRPDRMLGDTRVINVVPSATIELGPQG